MKSSNCILKVIVMFCIIAYSDVQLYGGEYLDVMQDFAHPVSFIENIRNDMAQALYAVEQENYDTAVAYLQTAWGNLQQVSMERHERTASYDDREFLQQMIDKINVLISQLENKTISVLSDSQRSMLGQLCSHIEGQL